MHLSPPPPSGTSTPPVYTHLLPGTHLVRQDFQVSVGQKNALKVLHVPTPRSVCMAQLEHALQPDSRHSHCSDAAAGSLPLLVYVQLLPHSPHDIGHRARVQIHCKGLDLPEKGLSVHSFRTVPPKKD